MKFKVKYLLMALPIIVLVACASKKPEKGLQLNGEFIHTHGNEKIYLLKLSSKSATPVDTISLDKNGKFSVNVPSVTEVGFYRLSLSDKNYVTLIFNPNEKVIVRGNIHDLTSTYSIEGSPDSELLLDINKHSIENFKYRDSLQKTFTAQLNIPNKSQAELDSTKAVIEAEFSQSVNDFHAYLKSFIETNSTSYASLAAVQQLPIENYLPAYVKLDKKLIEAYPNSEYVKSFHDEVKAKTLLSVGFPVPEISLPSPEGKVIPLSSLKGKVVLIDFWASWCGPCRRENPTVVKAYNKYKEKGFDIYSVSLDKDVNRWKAAIAKDQLTWVNHVSELKGWGSAVVKQYAFSGIPYNVLIDQKGNVIAKNLRGAALEQALSQVFK